MHESCEEKGTWEAEGLGELNRRSEMKLRR